VIIALSSSFRWGKKTDGGQVRSATPVILLNAGRDRMAAPAAPGCRASRCQLGPRAASAT